MVHTEDYFLSGNNVCLYGVVSGRVLSEMSFYY